MKITLLSAALLLGLGTGARAQSSTGTVPTGTQFGLQAGLSRAVLDGTINRRAGYTTGVAAGAFVRFRPSARIAIQPELNFVQQGAENELVVGYGTVLHNTTHLSYLNLPVLLKVYLGNVVNLQVGPQFGVLMSAHDKGQTGYISSSSGNSYVEEDLDVSSDYSGDVALCAGLGADLKNGLLLSARLNYGFTNISKNEADQQLRNALGIGGMHNRVMQFTIGYAFK